MTETFHAGPNLGRLSDVTIIHGDCLEAMAELAADSVDAIVTDPPYGLGFMGKAWDELPPGLDWAKQCLRILKPGGHLLAFGGTRTWHRLAVAVEDAGFEIRDSIAWLYGSGFPKSLDVSKAIDKAAGVERTEGAREWSGGQRSAGVMGNNLGTQTLTKYDTPATPEAEQWSGWGTALKPAFEPVVVARKPLAKGTVAANVLAHGTGALNIDACRIAHGADVDLSREQRQSSETSLMGGLGNGHKAGHVQPLYAEGGRWPANVVLDADQAAALDEQSGDRSSPWIGNQKGNTVGAKGGKVFGGGEQRTAAKIEHGDSGGASRFFYRVDADSLESEDKRWSPGPAQLRRMPVSDKYLDVIDQSIAAWDSQDYRNDIGALQANEHRKLLRAEVDRLKSEEDSPPPFFYCAKAPKKERPVAIDADGRTHSHATVKPLALMRWLVRLVTPPGGVVLDPFAGSGTTVEAALLEDFRVIGIEREADYLPMIQQRIARCLNF